MLHLNYNFAAFFIKIVTLMYMTILDGYVKKTMCLIIKKKLYCDVLCDKLRK